MKIQSLYTSVTETKTGLKIPVFSSGRTMESKYNPEREAQNLLDSITESFTFFTVFGIGSGLFISKLALKNPTAKIICVENTKEDLEFLSQFENVQNLQKNTNIIFTSLENLQSSLLNNYIPALYGNMKVIEMLGWKNENTSLHQFIEEELNAALQLISADFSVQTHFGKLWQHNILNNLKYISKQPVKVQLKTQKQTAVIIAAGPSLDSKISYLKEHNSELYIISTDTAYSSLIKSGIIPEVVVSIDGQFISHQHFLHKADSSTVFAFDLCSNNTCVQKAGKNCFFFNSGHPLSCIAAAQTGFPSLYTGAGTVTIAALDLAFFMGFKKIIVLAADFSYIKGKPYAKGTYLDNIYRNSENKLVNAETLFSKLMFRTQLQKIDANTQTTEVLLKYKNSFEKYLTDNGCKWASSNFVYEIENPKGHSTINTEISETVNFSDFNAQLQKNYKNQEYQFLLPYVAFLRNKYKNESFENLLNLAYSYFVRYNNFI